MFSPYLPSFYHAAARLLWFVLTNIEALGKKPPATQYLPEYRRICTHAICICANVHYFPWLRTNHWLVMLKMVYVLIGTTLTAFPPYGQSNYPSNAIRVKQFQMLQSRSIMSGFVMRSLIWYGKSLLGSKFFYAVIFINGFVAVDFREQLCYRIPTK